MKREIYLDNAATTKPLKSVADIVSQTMLEAYGNPSSLHKKGIEAENKLKEVSLFFAKELGCLPEEILYTSGGTESNNQAIIGSALAYKRVAHTIITTPIEHPSVGEVFKYLETEGFTLKILPVDEMGYVDLETLKQWIDNDTLLVSIMQVNNEIGTIQPIHEIGELIKAKNPSTLFHVDGVQGFSKVPINVKRDKVDFYSISAHKFYGPRGVGLLYKNKNVRMKNLLFGGGQQDNLRSGTENVPGIVGTLEAAKQVKNMHNEMMEHMRACKAYLASGLLKEVSDVWVNGPEDGAPYILNMSFKDVRSEVLLHALEEEGIYVSSGSACSSHKKSKQGVLNQIGLSKERLDSAIRFSFAYDTNLEDIKELIAIIKTKVEQLRKYTVGGKKK